MNRLASPTTAPAQPTSHAADAANTIIFQFTAKEIADADCTRFLCLLDVSGGCLRPGISKLRGNLCITFPECGEQASAPFLCETTRRFCREFFSAFPYSAFFLSLRNMSLWNLTLPLVGNAQVFEFAPASRMRIAFADDELSQIVEELVRNAQNVGDVAGFSVAENATMADEIRDYFARLVTSHANA